MTASFSITPVSFFRPARKLIVLIALTVIGTHLPLRAQITNNALLQANLTLSITVTGLVGSLQELQSTSNPADSNSWSILTFLRMGNTPTIYTDTNMSSAKRFYRTVLRQVADTNLMWIPPGTFLMGSPDTEQGHFAGEGPQTQVTLTYGFFMGRYEVRNIEWLGYMTNLFTTETTDPSLTNYLQNPVRSVPWSAATNYCAIRTADELATGKIPAGWKYRLPTEAEWEYACRAGTTTPFNLGSTLRNDDVSQDACFNGNFPYPAGLTPVNPINPTAGYPRNVGSYQPNGFGLYDMHGNVAELCLDRTDNLGTSGTAGVTYPGGSVTNPPPSTGANFILRGGAYTSFARGEQCRSAFRIARSDPGNGFIYFGFRVVLTPVNP